ncbi:MAG: hypothetical protein LBU17_02060 [Treponema sp.]|jgi:hypothetical protein|nr:hypothetical protein [Treponema sp.]
MRNKQVETVHIFRQLSPENQADFLTCVHLAHTAENSAKESLFRAIQPATDSSELVSVTKVARSVKSLDRNRI